jgi:hypothetical protein
MKVLVENAFTNELIGEFDADTVLESKDYDAELDEILNELSTEPVESVAYFEELKITRIDDDDLFSD